MIFTCVTLRILRCRHSFDRSVKSAYRRYILWTKTKIDATFVRDGLNDLHQLCNKYNIKMDVESSYVKRVVRQHCVAISGANTTAFAQQTRLEALIALSNANKKAVAALVALLLACPLQTFDNG